MTYQMPAGYTPDICIYHDPCADGLTAAWAVRMRWPNCEMRPARHAPGQAPIDVKGKHVLIVDYSFKRPKLLEMIAEAASITILDHHISAQRDLEPLLAEGLIQGEFDMTRSGAMMTWQFCFPAGVTNPFDKQYGSIGWIPYIVQYVQDRDIWKWELPDSKEVCAWLNLQPLTFEGWAEAALVLEDEEGYNKVVEIGGALVKKLDSDVASGIRATKRRMIIGGYDVPVANLPHFLSSEAGNALCQGEPFSATYFDTAEGGRSFSLRSDNLDPNAVDVSQIAVGYGGGGHKNAAGFSSAARWEGDSRVTVA